MFLKVTKEKEITLADFRAEYIEHREGIREKATVLADDLALRKLGDHVGHRTPLHRVRPRHGDTLMSRCTKQGLKPASVVNHYRHLHTAFNVAKIWEYIDDNPFSEVKPPRIHKSLPKFIPVGEIATFLEGIEDFDLRMLVTAYIATGRRRCELLALTWADIDWVGRKYRVRLFKTHTDAVFHVGDIFHAVLVEQAVFWGHRKLVFPRWGNPDTR